MHINNKSWQFVKGFYSILIIVLFIHRCIYTYFLTNYHYIGAVFIFFLFLSFYSLKNHFLHSLTCLCWAKKIISMIIIWMTIQVCIIAFYIAHCKIFRRCTCHFCRDSSNSHFPFVLYCTQHKNLKRLRERNYIICMYVACMIMSRTSHNVQNVDGNAQNVFATLHCIYYAICIMLCE